jgi:riboflavin kinase/FMN adenylyltransferase
VTVASWESFVAGTVPAAERAASVGVFDGLHRGHRSLLERIVSFDGSLEPTVFTFRESPKAILRPKDFEGVFSAWTKNCMNWQSRGGHGRLIDFSGVFGNCREGFVDS